MNDLLTKSTIAALTLGLAGLLRLPALSAQPPAQAPLETAQQALELLDQIESLQHEIERREQTEETRKRQDRILEIWDKLLEAGRKPPQNPPSPPEPPPMPQDGHKPQPDPETNPDPNAPQPQPQPAPAPDGTRRQDDPNEPVDRSTEKTNERKPASVLQFQTAERERLMRNVWGNLPEQVRARLRNASDEKYLPQYEDRIRAYFRALSTEKTDQ